MKQSRNLTRSVKELESLYEQVLEESTTPAGFEQEKSVSDELGPKNSGPEGIDNEIEDPIETDITDTSIKEYKEAEEADDDEDDDEEKIEEVNTYTKKEAESLHNPGNKLRDDHKDKRRQPGETAAEHQDRISLPRWMNAKKKSALDSKKRKENSKGVKQSNENTEKTNISNINTGMSDKNIFDKLYSTIMEADDELGDALDVGFGGEDESLDDLGDEGGDVTITLTQDQVDVLRDVLGQLEGEGADGDELEDLDMGGDLEEENPFPEGVEAETTSDGSTPGQDPSGLTGNNNKVGGEAGKVKSGGASADSSGQEDGGKPKSLPDTVSKMTSTGDNKVAGVVKGGNQGLLT